MGDCLTSQSANHAIKRSVSEEGTSSIVEHAARNGSRFSEVWQTLTAEPYATLPEDRVGLHSVYKFLKNAALLRAARRTLDSRADLLPTFRKLVHPIGITLRGTWRITHPTPYTGYFATGSEALILLRASDAMGETRPGKLRFLGMAGKLYPTRDPNHQELLQTANFFVFENIAGSHTRHFREATYTNDLLPPVPHPGALAKAPLMNVVGPAFALADRTLDPTQLMIRQLYPIAELGESDPKSALGPRYMRFVGVEGSAGPTTSDLREELDMRHYPDGLRFTIQVADRGFRLAPKAWQTIGEVHLTMSVASAAGDHNLHFAHPGYEKGRAERS